MYVHVHIRRCTTMYEHHCAYTTLYEDDCAYQTLCGMAVLTLQVLYYLASDFDSARVDGEVDEVRLPMAEQQLLFLPSFTSPVV